MNFKCQPGYIHPDEYFQTVEISAGEVLNVQIDSPWEFTSITPVRSKAVVELFLNIPLKIYLNLISAINASFLIPSDFLKICRLWTMFCSLIIDYCIYILSSAFHINTKLSLFIHATSYISLVFYSRTFSNTWETQLFSLFLIIFIRGKPLISEISQGAIIALGFFCRPTFPIFVLPIIFYRLLSMHLFKILKYFIHGCCGFIPVTIGLIIFDSLKYKGRLVISPLNFIFYNSNHNNLVHHGIHLWYTHILINFPLMLGVLSILIIFTPFLINRQKHITHLLIIVSFPIIILSLFPHQEMRFLLPIFPFAVLLLSRILENFRPKRGMIIASLTLHILFSAISVLFWGYLHEGGLKEASQLAMNRMSTSNAVGHTLVSYRTFLIPRFMLISPHIIKHSDQYLGGYGSATLFNYSIVNLMGIPESNFWNQIFTIVNGLRMDANKSGIRELHLIYPKAFIFEHRDFLKQIGTLVSNFTIRGHLNTDLLPPRVPLMDFLSLQYLSFFIN